MEYFNTQDNLTNDLNIPMASGDEAESSTQSAVADGTIIIRNKDQQKQDIKQLCRETKNTLNKLDKIFDKDKIEEKQELAGLFSELSFNAIHNLSKNWTEEQKVMAHALVGYVSGELANSKNSFSTALTAGVNKFVTEEILKDEKTKLHYQEHPEELQWISAALGAAIGQMAGGDATSGASIASSATKNNAEHELVEWKARQDPNYENATLEEQEKIENKINDDYDNASREARLDDMISGAVWLAQRVGTVGLKEGEIATYTVSGGIFGVSGYMGFMVVNDENKTVYYNEGGGYGLAVLPVDVSRMVGHLEDKNGNLITDSDMINNQLKGYSASGNAAIFYGGTIAKNGTEYTLITEGLVSNIAANVYLYNYSKKAGSAKRGVKK